MCSGPDTGMARADGFFSNGSVSGLATASGSVDPSINFRADVSIQAAYQITFFGPTGPGFMEADVCGFLSNEAEASFSLITPNGSMNFGFTRTNSCNPPYDIPITFGVPLDVQLSLNVAAQGIRLQAALVDFSYQALDAMKNPVSATAEIVIPDPST
jgi:hypothetical protein